MMYLTYSQLLQLIKTLSVYSAADAKRETKEQWHSINWEKAYRVVRSLQRRIVAAIKENRWGKVKSLQWIITHSFYAKVIAIKRVTENTGSRTSGIDGETWSTRKAKWNAISTLKRKGYKASAVKRVKIPKDNGKYRMLGIPTMRDRAMQALYLLALEPVAETNADIHSYGFRPYRNCHDALEQCHIILSRKDAPQYILEGDIKACFDNISHKWLTENIPIHKGTLIKWLKAGYIEKQSLYPTTSGTPQGSVISPVLANMVLDGLQQAIDKACGIRQTGIAQSRRVNNPNSVHLIRYADDFVVSCKDKHVLQTVVQLVIETFLQERGLSLSTEKTSITAIEEGFDFLGQHIRKYKGKLLIKPSKKNVKTFLDKVQKLIRQSGSKSAYEMTIRLNSMIKGWAMYHRHIVARRTYTYVDNRIWNMLWKWALKRHRNKSKGWVKQRYFQVYKGRDWIFTASNKDSDVARIFHATNISIKRHIKIRSQANPFDATQEMYFEKRLQRQLLNKFSGKQLHRFIYKRQNGKCNWCQQPITLQTGWHLHHLIPKHMGGKGNAKNLVMLHPVCHVQVHHQKDYCCADHKRLKCLSRMR